MTLFSGAANVGSRRLTARRPSIVSVLDVGSSKVCCLIAKLTPREAGELLPGRTHGIEVLGLGHVKSRGIKSGVVIDLDAAEMAIRHAVDAAERAAHVTVELVDRQHIGGAIGERDLHGERRAERRTGERERHQPRVGGGSKSRDEPRPDRGALNADRLLAR